MLNRKFLLIIITVLLVCIITVNEARKKRKSHGPRLTYKHSTSCSEFSRYGRFNPYSVLNEIWFVFFYWAVPKSLETYKFFIPTANHTKTLHKVFDGNVTIPVNWTARLVIMQNRLNNTWLLVERGDRGQYWSYSLREVQKYLIKPRDIRLRQHDNGRLLGLMHCDTESLYVMSRIREVPLHSKIQDEAARFGFRARRGKSYLYQGHEWMPIPEADENDFFETIVPEIENEVNNQSEILHVRDHSTEDKKTCNLKEKLSKYKSADLSSPDSCLQESSELSKEADSKNMKMDKFDSNELKGQNNERIERAEYYNKREENVKFQKEKIEEANNLKTETGNIDHKEKFDSDIFISANPVTKNVRSKNIVDSDGSVHPESQFNNEPKELKPTNEFTEQSSKTQIQPNSKLLRETEKVNEIKEDKYINGLDVSETAFAFEKKIEKSTDSQISSTSRHTKGTSKQRNSHSSDLAKNIIHDIPYDWGGFNTNNIAYLRPVDNTNFIEQESPEPNNEIKDPIAPSGVLPEKCYKMEMVSETEEFTPTYVPPIFNELYEKETTINPENIMQEKQQK